MINDCPTCGTSFKQAPKSKRFCSYACSLSGRKPANERPISILNCTICLRKAGVSIKRIPLVIPIVSYSWIHHRWKEVGFDCGQYKGARAKIRSEKSRDRIEKISATANQKRKEKERIPRLSQREKYFLNHEQNKQKCAQRARLAFKAKYKIDPIYTTKHILRRCVKRLVRFTGRSKNGKSERYLGCSFNHARKHLEQQFKPGMSWANYGEWEVDHILPLASFDLTNESHIKVAGHYKNLQPLWRIENRIKSDKVIDYTKSIIL